MQNRILLVDMPRMLRELIRDLIRDQPDMLIVGEIDQEAALATTFDATGSTCVIVGQDNPGFLHACLDLLGKRSLVKVLGVTGDAHEISLYELRLQKYELGEMSAEGLLAVIRRASDASPEEVGHGKTV